MKDLGSKSGKRLRKSGGEIWFVANHIFFFGGALCFLSLQKLIVLTVNVNASANVVSDSAGTCFCQDGREEVGIAVSSVE